MYVKLSRNRIVEVSETIKDGFVYCENAPDRILDHNGAPVWMFIDGEVVRRTDEDIANDTPGDWIERPLSPIEKLTQRTDALEATTDDIILLMAEIIGG